MKEGREKGKERGEGWIKEKMRQKGFGFHHTKNWKLTLCYTLQTFSTDRGFPLPSALLSAPLSICLSPLHPTPQWCGGWRRRRTLRWRRGGWEGPAEHQVALCARRCAGGQDEATRRVRKLKFYQEDLHSAGHRFTGDHIPTIITYGTSTSAAGGCTKETKNNNNILECLWIGGNILNPS